MQKHLALLITVALFLNLTLPTLAEVKNEMSAAFPMPGESGALSSEEHVRTDIVFRPHARHRDRLRQPRA